MAYDVDLADRVRRVLAGRPGWTEKAMFGGVAWMLDDHMAVGLMKDDLMVRVDPAAHAVAVARPHVRTMEFGGRSMKGFVLVDPDGTASDAALEGWIDEGARFAASLPPKPAKAPKPRKAERGA